MTFRTGYINMFPIEFEGSFIMIEVRSFPVFGIVTFRAISGSVFLKLLVMLIIVTIWTILWQARKFWLAVTFWIVYNMTHPAVLLFMSSREFKFGFRMIKCYIIPSDNVMTYFTIPVRIILSLNQVLMYVFMTIFTIQSDSTEVPIHLLFMTIVTGYCKMRIF